MHGETICMRGLVLSGMGRKPEAYEAVRKGLRLNMSSHVCWHVFGLVYRADKNYKEAIKCYKQALRIDEDNMQILRDLSLLQIQMRDLRGFNETRRKILALKANQKFHWIAAAMSYHLLDEHDEAIRVIDSFLDQGLPREGNEREHAFGISELQMYKNTIMSERGTDLDAVLKHLTTCEESVLDEGGYKQQLAALKLQMSDHAGAASTYMSLFDYGVTEDYRPHSGYMCALLNLDSEQCKDALNLTGTSTVATVTALTDDQNNVLLEAYKALNAKYEKSSVIKRIMLTLLTGDELETAMYEYIKKGVKKGVPSLSSDLAALYVTKGSNGDLKSCRVCKDPVDIRTNEKFIRVTKIVDGMLASLESDGNFGAGDSANVQTGKIGYRGEKEAEETLKDILVWVRYLKVQLLELTGDYEDSLALLEKCLEVFDDADTEAIDLYERKARLLKLSGDVQLAAETVDDARKRDTADRYINNKTTKYLLRAGKQEQAEQTIGMFTRHEANPNTNLFEMQCSWYELEYARCMWEQNDVGKALKKFVAVEKHFDDFADDQFDFHTYCIRKMTLRAYYNILRLEDHIWGHKYYQRAAEGAIKCYLHLVDHPPPRDDEEPDFSQMTAAQKKNAKAAIRKKKNKEEAQKKEIEEAKKKAAEDEAKRIAEEDAEDEKDEKEGKEKKKRPPRIPVEVDEDPEGMELMKKDAATELMKFCDSLKLHAPNDVNSWVLNYTVCAKLGKWMLALQALSEGMSCSGCEDSPKLFMSVIDFSSKFAANTITFENENDETVQGDAAELAGKVLGGLSADDYFLKVKTAKGDESLEWKCAIARAGAILSGAEQGAAAAKAIVDAGLEGLRGAHKIPACVDAATCIKELGGEELEGQWKAKCKARYPRSTVF
jgi:peptide alpha-N-acetyltransferase